MVTDCHRPLREAQEFFKRFRPMQQLDNVQNEVAEWADRNFAVPPEKSYQPLLGIGEETGELMHAHLKSEQGIRGSAEEHDAAAKDALGDIMVFMLHYCHLRGWSLWECLTETWEQVKKRDWKKNRTNGQARQDDALARATMPTK